MIRANRWAVIATTICVVLSFLTAAPLLLPHSAQEKLASIMPSWYPSMGPNLGLDLQGGAHLLLQVDMETALNDRLSLTLDALRSDLRAKKIAYQNLRVDRTNNQILFRLRDAAKDGEEARNAIRRLGLEYQLISEDPNGFAIGMTDTAARTLSRQVIDQSIEIIRRRVDETGTREPVIQAQGDDRVLVQLPGIQDPAGMKKLLGTTAKLTFHLLDPKASPGSLTLPLLEDPTQKLSLQREALLAGDSLTDAQATYDESGPAVSFRFDAIGARKFCEISTNNVGQPFAIVLDNDIISAPTIREPICGGTGVINGGFTVKESSELAVLLRAGALPAPLKIIEERTIGPSLGSDSIKSGVTAGWVTFLLVILFLLPTYLTFGLIAAIALVVNITMLFAITMLFGATLTLPGIAGIILTIGMAVDSNVIMFERIRDEMRLGKSVYASVDVGFSRAMVAVLDANLTTLVAAIIMFTLGSGPIKGFAVTLTFGIITTVFSASLITKYMIMWYLKTFKPKELAL